MDHVTSIQQMVHLSRQQNTKLRSRNKSLGRSDESKKIVSHNIHVWYIYLHLVDFYGTCR